MPALAPAPTPRWHPCSSHVWGWQGNSSCTCFPSTWAFGRASSSPLSLLMLGVSWDLAGIWHPVLLLGRGSPGFATHAPSCFLTTVDTERKRRGPPARQVCPLSLATAEAASLGSLEELESGARQTWGADYWSQSDPLATI